MRLRRTRGSAPPQSSGSPKKGGIRQAIRGAVRVARNVPLAPFLPLIPVARQIYRQRVGREAPKEPFELLIAFYRDVMKRSVPQRYEGLYDLEPATIGMIVGAVVSFIADLAKRSREKRRQGAQPTPEEKAAEEARAEDAQAFTENPQLLAQGAEYIPLMEEYYQNRTNQTLSGNAFAKFRTFHTAIVQREASSNFDLSSFEAWSFTYEKIPTEEQLYDFDAGTIVSSIISFFQRFRDRVRERERTGQRVQPWEKRIADRVDAIEQKATSEAEQTVSQRVEQKVGRGLLQATPIILLGLGGLLVYALSKRR